MRIAERVFSVLSIMLLLPAQARSQTPIGGIGRSVRSWYAGVGAMASGAGGGVMLRAGAILNDHFLLGAEAGFSGHEEYEGTEKLIHEYTYVDAMGTWYPFVGSGAYLKGGVGYGSSTEDRADGSEDESREGVEVRLGAGWEFKVVHLFSKDFCLGLELATGANSAARGGDLLFLMTLGLY